MGSLSQGRLAIDLSLFTGIFLFLLSFGTFSWLGFIYGGYGLDNSFPITSFYNAVLLGSVFLIWGSLFYMQFGFRENKLPSRKVLIDFLFVIGFFLFVGGESIYSMLFGGSLAVLDTGYAYIYVGLALICASLFLWNKERTRSDHVGLSLEVISTLCVALILADVFVFSYGNIAIPFQMPFGAFVVLVGCIIGLIMGINGLIYAKKKAFVNPEGMTTSAIPTAQKPIHHTRIATYGILAIIAVFIFFGVPMIPWNSECVRGIMTPATFVFNYGNLWPPLC